MSSTIWDSLTSSFPFWITFVFCSYLIALAGYSKTILNRSGETRQPCPVYYFEGNGFVVLHLVWFLAIGLSFIAFIMLRNILWFIVSAELLSWTGVGFCQMLFLGLLRVSFGFCSCICLCTMFMDLHMLNHPCIPGMKLTWSWCMIFLMCCWILFASILLRIFASIFIKNTGL
jgi:hypothetical protein